MELESSDNGSDSPPLPEDSPKLSQFIEDMGLHFEDYEVSRIGGRMIGLLLITSRPLTSEEMAETLQVSRSSISTNLKILLSEDLVEKVSIPGDRVDYYVIEPDFWKKIIELRLSSLLEIRESAVESLESMKIKDPAKAQMKSIVSSLDIVEEMVKRLRSEWQSQQEVPA